MKRIAFLTMSSFFLIITGAASAARDADIVTVETLTPIEVGKTRDVDGRLTSLNTQAREAGMSDAVLHGSVKYREAGKGKRAVIYWDSIKWSNGSSNTEGGIDKPLISQFTTNDERVEPQTALTAKGDIGSLTQSFDNVKKRVAATQAAQAAATQAANPVDGQQTAAANNGAVSGGYVPGSGSYDPTSGTNSGTSAGNDGLAVDPVSTTWETCPPRIAQSEGLVYRQQKAVKKNTAGDVLDEGACEDRGGTVPITKEYTGCQANFDFENKVMYSQYKEVADLDGLILTVSGCTIDTTKSTPLQSTFEGCGVRHDFVNGVSVQLEQLFYRDDANKVINVGDCQDSEFTYQQFKTSQTCTNQVDSANGFVIPYQRIAYNLNDGTVEYASECQAQSTTGIPIQEETCDPKYEHDFISNVSYLRTQSFYIDQSNQKVILSACQRSTANSFTHKFDDAECSITNDDVNLMTHWTAKRFIETTDDGNVVISDCEEYNNPTPYSFTGDHTDTSVYVWPASSTAEYVMNSLIAPANQGSGYFQLTCNDTFFVKGGGVAAWGTNIPPDAHPCTDRNQSFQAMSYYYDMFEILRSTAHPLQRTISVSYHDYLRGDGTTYSRPFSEIWAFKAQ